MSTWIYIVGGILVALSLTITIIVMNKYQLIKAELEKLRQQIAAKDTLIAESIPPDQATEILTELQQLNAPTEPEF